MWFVEGIEWTGFRLTVWPMESRTKVAAEAWRERDIVPVLFRVDG